MKYTVIENMQGTQWCKVGTLIRHKEDGPAFIRADGSKLWYINDKLHRTDGPAIEFSYGTNMWYTNGMLHREDGPAAEYATGEKCWYINGNLLTEKQFNARNTGNNKIIEIDGKKYKLVEVKELTNVEKFLAGEEVLLSVNDLSTFFASAGMSPNYWAIEPGRLIVSGGFREVNTKVSYRDWCVDAANTVYIKKYMVGEIKEPPIEQTNVYKFLAGEEVVIKAYNLRKFLTMCGYNGNHWTSALSADSGIIDIQKDQWANLYIEARYRLYCPTKENTMHIKVSKNWSK